tara:strand:- start:400 stop:852 length:453 start_codon:yes stop_codon:yes gene_type:complete
MHSILTFIFIGFVIIFASCNSGLTTSSTVAEAVAPVAKTIVRFGKPHFGLFVRLLFDASNIPLLLIDQMRDGRLLKLVYGSDSALNRGERQTKRVLNQMIKNTMVNVDTVNGNEAARVLFKLKTSTREIPHTIGGKKIQITSLCTLSSAT